MQWVLRQDRLTSWFIGIQLMTVIFTLKDESGPFTKSLKKKSRLFEVVAVGYEDRCDIEKVEALLNGINI